MPKALTPVQKTAGLLFLGITFCYLAMGPGSIEGRGYVQEEMDSGMRMLEVFNAWMKGRHIPPMVWSRHGPIPVIFDLLFLKAGKSFISPNFVLSLEPILSTAALLTILFLWLRKLCSPSMSLLLTLTAAFGTLLWPYAYIGLETKQSLFVLLAGYLGIANGKIERWPKLILLAFVCGFAMTLKSTGIVLWPAFAYLLIVQFRDDWRTRWPKLLGSTAVASAVVAIGVWSRNFYWTPLGGGAAAILPWMIKSPFQFFTNAIGLIGSPTKGVLIFAPILILSLFTLSTAFSRHRDVTIFAVLVTVCTLGFMSLMTYGADEVWGSRYFHIAVAPMVLCIGCAWSQLNWRRNTLIALLAVVGTMISFLGAFYYYGNPASAMSTAGENTMEWINGDPIWNEVTTNARLFQVWMKGGNAPEMWTPTHLWVWEPPAGAQPFTPINLRDYCIPQSALLGLLHVPRYGAARTLFRLCAFSLLAGPLLLGWTVLRTVRGS